MDMMVVAEMALQIVMVEEVGLEKGLLTQLAAIRL